MCRSTREQGRGGRGGGKKHSQKTTIKSVEQKKNIAQTRTLRIEATEPAICMNYIIFCNYIMYHTHIGRYVSKYNITICIEAYLDWELKYIFVFIYIFLVFGTLLANTQQIQTTLATKTSGKNPS